MEDNSLLAAVSTDDTDAAVALLRAATKSNVAGIVNGVCSENGSTPLMYAAQDGNAVIVAALLRATGEDGDVVVDLNLANKDGITALMCAAEKGNAAVVATLVVAVGQDGVAVDLNIADENGMTALILAADKGYTYVVAALLAAFGKGGVAVDLNVVTKEGWTALLLAASKGHAAVVAALVVAVGENGVAVDLNAADKDGRTALIWASHKGHTTVIDVLVNAVGKGSVAIDLNAVDKHGMTALLSAAHQGHAAVAAALLNSVGKDGVAVDVNFVNTHGLTALMYAAGEGHAAVVKVLIDAPGKDGVAVDLNLATKDGMTALMCAAGKGHAAVVDALVIAVGQGGVAVDLNVVGGGSITALKAAFFSKSIETVKVLLNHNVHVDEEMVWLASQDSTPEIVHELKQKVPSKTCSACKENKYHSKFAKVQLKKSGADRRCIICVEQGKLAPNAKTGGSSDATLLQCSACAVEKAPTHFSKAQRGKKDARKCGECITQAESIQKEAKATAAAAKLLDAEAASSGKHAQQKQHKKGKQKGANGIKAGSTLPAEEERDVVEANQLAAKLTAQTEAAKTEAAKTREAVEKEATQARDEAAKKEASRAAIREAEWEAAEAATAEAAAKEKAERKEKKAQKKAQKKATTTTAATSAAPTPTESIAAVQASTPNPPHSQPPPQPTALHQSPQPPPTTPIVAPRTPLPPPPQAQAQAPHPPQPHSPPATIPDLLELEPSCLTLSADVVLGSGSFATVYGGSYVFPVHGATSVAIKVFHGTAGDRPGRGKAAAITELMASTRVSVNAHLVQMYGAARLPLHGVCLVMERIVGQSLRIVLDTTAEVLPWELRSRWLQEIAQGMNAMHQHKPTPVLHRDLKASNVLLDSLDVVVSCAKIADFGVAKAMDKLVVDTYSRGARDWSAPEALRGGKMSFPVDVYSYGVVTFEVLTRMLPFADKSDREKHRIEVLQMECAQFEYDEDIFEDEAIDEKQQRIRWTRKRDKSFHKRRPDLTLLSADCPTPLVVVMQECWLDESAERPTFANIVARLALLASNSNGGGGNGGGGSGAKKQRAPKVSIYSLCADEFQKANVGLAEEGLSREKASEIFMKGLVGTLERLFKEVVGQHKLSMPAGKAPGLGTYYRTIRDGKSSSGGVGVFDDHGIVPAMDKLCSHRNQVVHEDVQHSVATIRQHALTCGKVLDALKAVYAM